MRESVRLAGAIAFCQSVGIASSFFTIPAAMPWYEGLAKSTLTPPFWAFGFAWGILYTLMGIALYLVWRQRTTELCHCTALGLFLFQLALNAFWPYLFFGLREPLLAFIEIIILFFAVLATIWNFWSISRLAAYLLVPYILWITFAAYLIYAILRLH